MTDVISISSPDASNKSGGSWLALLAGVAAVAIGAYALLRGGKTSSFDDSGAGGYYESLGGGSEDTGSSGGSGVPTLPGGSTLPGVPTQPEYSAVADGSAISAFSQAYGVNRDSVENVLGLSNFFNEETNAILGAKYQNYLNTEKTLVTDASGNQVYLGTDLDPVLGLGKTIYFHQEKGEGLAGTPDSNALAASGLLGGAIAGVSQEQAPLAAAVSIAKWFDSPNMSDASKRRQAAVMGLAWSPQTGLVQRSATAQVAAAKQANASLAAKQAQEKAAQQQAAQQQAALAAQQAAQASKSSGSSGSRSSGGSSGGSRVVAPSVDSGVYVTNKGGKTGSASLSSVIGSLGKYTSKSGSSSGSKSSSSSGSSSSKGKGTVSVSVSSGSKSSGSSGSKSSSSSGKSWGWSGGSFHSAGGGKGLGNH